MANADTPFGFKPYGDPTDCHPHEYPLAAANSEIFIGSPVKIASGYVDLGAAGIGKDAIGISAQYRAANAGATAETATLLVYDDPRMLFVVQGVSGTPGTQAMVGDMCDHVATETPADIYGAEELNIASLAGDGNSAQFLIIDYLRSPDNALGDCCKWIVKFAEHLKLGGAVSVGA